MNSRPVTNSTPRACLPCRNKHLKCDGKTPICARCSNSGTDDACVFLRSRRGQRGGGRRSDSDAVPSSRLPDSIPLQLQRDLPPLPDLHFDVGQSWNSQSEGAAAAPHVASNTTDHDHHIELYYQYIHPAHPFLLPRTVYLEDPSIFPHYLENIICFIVNHHSSEDPDDYRERSNVVLDPSIPEDGFKVQALILLTLASYARFERDLGNKALSTAIDVALRIGINSNTFGCHQGPLFQESWRRTWWELYSVTGLISLIGGTNLRLSQHGQMGLPTHCEEYNTCQNFQVKTAEEMQHRFTSEENFRWSSFAYRIEAMRILSNILTLGNDPSILRGDAANASISSYLLSLPPEKQEGLRKGGEIDEVMICALMIIHLASICLHLPRSSLANIKGFKTVCGNDRGKVVGQERKEAHRTAALKSANALSNLLSSRTSFKTLSPCFSCAIAFGAVVQLSEWFLEKSVESSYLKEHIQLELMALNTLGEIWPIARVVRGQTAQFTRELLATPSQDSFSSQPTSEQGFSDDQWMQDLTVDDFEIPSEGIFFTQFGV